MARDVEGVGNCLAGESKGRTRCQIRNGGMDDVTQESRGPSGWGRMRSNWELHPMSESGNSCTMDGGHDWLGIGLNKYGMPPKRPRTARSKRETAVQSSAGLREQLRTFYLRVEHGYEKNMDSWCHTLQGQKHTQPRTR